MSQKNERNEENTCCAIQSFLGETASTRMHKNEQINITYFKLHRSNFGKYLYASSMNSE